MLYLANTPFIKSKSLDELFFAMLLLHIVFKIQFPQTIRNTAVFLLSVSGNKSLLQKEESLPDRIKSKLRKKYDMTAWIDDFLLYIYIEIELINIFEKNKFWWSGIENVSNFKAYFTNTHCGLIVWLGADFIRKQFMIEFTIKNFSMKINAIVVFCYIVELHYAFFLRNNYRLRRVFDLQP